VKPSVLAFNDPASTGSPAAPTKVLGAQTTVRNYNILIGGTKVEEGWMRLDTPSADTLLAVPGPNIGLPIIGERLHVGLQPRSQRGRLGQLQHDLPAPHDALIRAGTKRVERPQEKGGGNPAFFYAHLFLS